MKKLLLMLMACAIVFTFSVAASSCDSDADVASYNMSKAADNFEVNRRIVFFNGITDTYLMTIEGRCSLGNDDTEYRLSVTCKLPDGTYKKHFLGLSDNVSFFVEQVQARSVSADRYRVVFKPNALVPDPDVRLGFETSPEDPN